MTQTSDFRFKKQHVKTARGRTAASARWIQRHINDRFVLMAKQQKYRSRAAFKLLGIEDKFHVLRGSQVVVDLGAAPGSWLQVVRKVAPQARVIGIDLQEIIPLDEVQLIVGDFCDQANQQLLQQAFQGKVSVVLSDMAASASGDRQVDHMRIMHLVRTALDFARLNLRPNGNFVAKILRGGEEAELLQEIRKSFKKVQVYKPEASYNDSAEAFIVAQGFKGVPT
ncbi:MAG: RlmE family RNA methyltransferase [Proteobacteria bacterium]|nr:RlmE family RNA methyltransferase [Pseudomonadota bacterium]